MIYDLSVDLSNDTYTYPTDPDVKIINFLNTANNPSNVSIIHMGSHSGTHIDAPLHFYDGKEDVSKIALEKCCGYTKVWEILKDNDEDIDMADFKKINIMEDHIALIRTGWEERLNKSSYYTEFPHITANAAKFLVSKKIKAFASDLPSVDSNKTNFESHRILLDAGIPIIEGLVNLKTIVDKSIYFFAFPLKIVHGDGSPVRAVGIDLEDLFVNKKGEDLC